ncbi:hypothetical protein [Stagnihabitans tardus]|uniref:Uncharacterized protein n=1 Tax=Stagnihabitans tardus TaxID=2699202 RepID=A0AAE5BVK6_9RHOB|nr:hypothetical protein [Stagnihabitans tardus]NBZ87859.1 hypothetical protein [Stagnihabitans tardus]
MIIRSDWPVSLPEPARNHARQSDILRCNNGLDALDGNGFGSRRRGAAWAAQHG